MQLPQQPEKPIYVLRQKKSRALVPKIISLLVLGVIFYLGLLLNLTLLELSPSNESIVNIIALIILALIVIIGVYLAVYKASHNYKFYKNRVVQGKNSMIYTNITQIIPHHDPIDKIFHTYSIKLSNSFFIRNIPDQVQMQSYIQQLIDYAKRTQQ